MYFADDKESNSILPTKIYSSIFRFKNDVWEKKRESVSKLAFEMNYYFPEISLPTIFHPK